MGCRSTPYERKDRGAANGCGAALLTVAADAIIGLATQRLVARVRRQAKASRAWEHMLEQVTEVVHSLFDSPQPRNDVCEAARTIRHASAALLYEPDGDTGQLICSALAGIDMPADKLIVDRRSAAYEAFQSVRSKLITRDVEAHIGLIELWIASGRPTYEEILSLPSSTAWIKAHICDKCMHLYEVWALGGPPHQVVDRRSSSACP